MSSLRLRMARVFTSGLSVVVYGALLTLAPFATVATVLAFIDGVRPVTAQADEGSAEDSARSGSFELYRGGVRIGSETWSLATDASGVAVLTGQCAVEIDGVSTTIHPSLKVDAVSLTPLSYEYERTQGDDVRRVLNTFEGGRVAQKIEENGMSSKRQLKIKPAELVINDDVLSQFLLVAERYDFERGGTQDFTVFDAKTDRNYVAHAMVRGLGTVENGLGKFRVRRLTLNLEELSVDVYVDGRGQVPQIAIPIRGIEARMPGYRGEEKAERSRTAPTPALGARVTGQ